MNRSLSEISIRELFLTILRMMDDDKSASLQGRTKIQKIIFILKNEFKLSQPFKYFRYTHGPYSAHLQDEIDKLTTFKLVDEKTVRLYNYWTYEYSLTDHGREFAESLIRDFDGPTMEYLNKMIARAKKLYEKPLDEVIEKAYEYVPEGLS